MRIPKALCLTGLLLLAAAGPVAAAATAITSVVAGTNGSPPYTLQSITVGSYTVAVQNLRTGTTAGAADQGGAVANMDSFDLNSIAARNNPTPNTLTTTMFGGQTTWQDTNGNQPDFFLFEAGMNDNGVTVQAILPGGGLGQAITLPNGNTWGDTGLDRVGAPNAGQSIGGVCWAITDLKDAGGAFLTNGSVIQGLVITSSTLDPTCLCAVAGGQSAPHAHAGPDRNLTLPANSTTLNGAGDDDDGYIVSYHWDKISGPSAALNGVNEPNLLLSDLVEGSYVFRLTVTDDDNLTGADDAAVAVAAPPGPPVVGGELKVWHRVSVTFDGPPTSEAATPNPFTDYRLQVTFTGPSSQVYDVPGFYAADGNAAQTSATGGTKWRVHFTPDQVGPWNYLASFRTGSMINVSLDPNAGAGAGYCDGQAGAFTVAPTDKTPPDFRARGMLRYVGRHQLQFAGDGTYYLKGGADSPENFLGYFEFDGTYDLGNLGPSTPDHLHHYAPHLPDWQPGDPNWQGTKGRGIIGAINYLSSKDVNNIYFLTYNIDGGDGRDTWIWTADAERWRIDASKMDQWEIVFSHMDAQGLQLHLVTTETENDYGLGSGFTDMRKLYYRELVARFAHHHALIWNLGEENDNTAAERQAYAKYLHDLDPYDHPVTVHTHYNNLNNTPNTYDPLYGNANFEATSLQGDGSRYNAWDLQVRQKSAAAGRPWAVYGDEQGPAVNQNMNNLDTLRQGTLWGNLMGGGAGVEWYFGYQGDFSDCGLEEFSSAAPLWDMTKVAVDFFQNYLPFWEMAPDNALTSAGNDFCLARLGAVYAVYLPSGGTTDITLPAGVYRVKWYNPRAGGPLHSGSVTSLVGPGVVSLGQPPADPALDWTVLIRSASQWPELSGDDCIGLPDLKTLTEQWLATGGAGSLLADLNGSGQVDLTDCAILAARWLDCDSQAGP